MAQLTEIATVFSFGDRTDIATVAAGRSVYLAAAGGVNSTLAPASTILNAIVTRPGTLKNLCWSCDPPNSLPATGSNFTVFVNGAITGLSAPCENGATSGSDATNTVTVAAGDRVSVRLQLAGGATTKKIPKPRASFELEVPSTNPWQAAGTDVYYDQGNVGIGTTPDVDAMLTVNGAVKSMVGGFIFPDGSVQDVAAGGAGGGIPASALFAAATEYIGIGTTSPEERLTLAADSNSATEMTTPTGVTATAKPGGSLPLATYYFRIVAEDDAGGTTTGSLPEASCTTTTANRTAHLDWAPVQGAKGYLVFIGTAPGGQNKSLTSPTNSFDYPSVSPSEIPGTVPPVTTAFVNKLSAAGSSWILGGNVGIGTSNPQAKLDVNGAISGFGIVPIGSIIAWHKSLTGGPSLPDGWVECAGQTLSDVDSPYNGQVIPDLNSGGRFLRGSATSGTLQADAFQGHYHEIIDPGGINGHIVADSSNEAGIGPALNMTFHGSLNVGSPKTDNINGTPKIANETRPVNMSVVWIMRVK